MPKSPTAERSATRFMVRLYDEEQANAWHVLRLELGAKLGRIPSRSELAGVLGLLAAEDPTVREALADRLASTGRAAS